VGTQQRKIPFASLAWRRSVHAGPKPGLTSHRRLRSGVTPSDQKVSLGSVLANWAGLVALWALPYLTLLEFLRVDAAQSHALQWLLLAIGSAGLGSLLYIAAKQARDPAWRAKHGLLLRRHPDAPQRGRPAS
jgi:hypothetical protein